MKKLYLIFEEPHKSHGGRGGDLLKDIRDAGLRARGDKSPYEGITNVLVQVHSHQDVAVASSVVGKKFTRKDVIAHDLNEDRWDWFKGKLPKAS